MRSMGAAARRMEREAERERRRREKEESRAARLRELQAQRDEKIEALERAQNEVEDEQEYLNQLISLHKEQSEIIDWEKELNTPPPIEPSKSNRREEEAILALNSYQPGFWDKVTGKDKREIARLSSNLMVRKQEDEQEFQYAFAVYQNQYSEWELKRELAQQILAGNIEAYSDAITELNPFAAISNLGSNISFSIADLKTIAVELTVNGEKVIPSELKSLTKSGKITTKSTPKNRFYELYQDHVCSAVIRVALELFALLPIETVVAVAFAEGSNLQTGHFEKKPILKARISKSTIDSLRLDGVDPSEAMKNFSHQMGFKRSEGFQAISI